MGGQSDFSRQSKWERREVAHSRQKGRPELEGLDLHLGNHRYSDMTSVPSVRNDMAGDKCGKV